MLFPGIDQPARQITVSLRDEKGDVLLARQVSTQPEKINAFFQQLTRERLRNGDSFVAVLEVCGFNEWLIRMLQDDRCQKVILIQPDDAAQDSGPGADTAGQPSGKEATITLNDQNRRAHHDLPSVVRSGLPPAIRDPSRRANSMSTVDAA